MSLCSRALRAVTIALFGSVVMAGAFGPSAAAAPTREESAEARQHFQKGQRHYDLHEYAEALAEFKDAYRFVPDPVLLYNIGQCHWKLGQKQDAVVFYRQYLRRRPDAANHDEVQARADELEAELAAEAKRSIPARPPSQTERPAPARPANTDSRATPAPTLERTSPEKTSPAPLPSPEASFSSARVSPSEPALNLNEPTPPSEVETPVYKRWWFWTAAAVVVAAGITTAVLASDRTQVGNCLDLGANCARIGQ